MSNFNDQYAFSSSGLNEATLQNALKKLSAEYQVKTAYTRANLPVPLSNINMQQFQILDCPLIITDGSYLRIDVDYYLGVNPNVKTGTAGTAVPASNNTYTIANGEGILHPMNYPRSGSNLIQRSSMQINNYTYSNENDTGVHSDISYLYQSMDYFKSTFNQHWNIYTPNELGGPSILLSQNEENPQHYIHLEEKDYLWINKTGEDWVINTDAWVPGDGTAIMQGLPQGKKEFKITKTFIIPYKYLNSVFTSPMINVYSTNNPILTLTISFVDQLKEMLTVPIVYTVQSGDTTSVPKNIVYYATPWIRDMACYTKTIINYVDNKSAAKALSRFKIDNTYVLPIYTWRMITDGYRSTTIPPEQSWTYSPTDTAMVYNIISMGMVVKQALSSGGVNTTNYRSDYADGITYNANGTNVEGNEADNTYLATRYSNGYYPLLQMIDMSDFNVMLTANNIQLNLKPNIDKIDTIQQNTYATGYFWDEDNGMNYGKISLYQFDNGHAFILFNFADIFNTFYKSGLMISPSSTLKVKVTFTNKNKRNAADPADSSKSITLDVRTYAFYKQYFTIDDSGLTGLEQLNMAVEAERMQELEQ